MLEPIKRWIGIDPNFNCVLTSRTVSPNFVPPEGIIIYQGTVYNALAKFYLEEFDIKNTDVYVAGPTKTIKEVIKIVLIKGFSKDRILIKKRLQ